MEHRQAFVDHIIKREPVRVHVAHASAVLTLLAVVALSHARQVPVEAQVWPRQEPFVLPDADGDGHPVFGNPTILAWPIMKGLAPGATSVVFGDLNGNGANDAVITNTTRPSSPNAIARVNILLNKGDGIFEHFAMYPAGQETTHADLADFDGDRVLDIVVANGVDGTISVLRGKGDGTFEPAMHYHVGGNARCVRAADLDDDGHIDLAVLLTVTREIVTLRNRGDGTFEVWRRLAVPGIPTQYIGSPCPGPFFVVGDLNNNRLPDIVVPAGPVVRVLINEGDGVFAPPSAYPAHVTGGFAYGLALGDLDRNGHLDLAVALLGGSKFLSILKNDGKGGFVAPVEYDMATRPNWPGGLYDPLSVTLGDITGNGYPDVCVGSVSTPNVAVRDNNGDGTFGERRLYDLGATGLWVVQFAELSGDGKVDLAAINESGRSKLLMLLNRGGGELLAQRGVPPEYEVIGQPYPWTGTPWSVIAEDVNRNGSKDLVVAISGSSRQSLVLIVHNDDGRFERWTPYDIGQPGMAAPRDVAAGDFNDDGWPDIVVADAFAPGGWLEPGKIWILLNHRDGTFAAPAPYSLDGVYPIRVAVGDLNGNGHDDIAALVSEVYPGNDIIPVDRRIVILWNDGEGNFTIGPSHTIWTYPWLPVGDIKIMDLDGDTRMDVVAVVSHRDGPGVLAVLRGLGGGEFAPVVTYPVPHARAMALGSFDLGLEAWIASSPTTAAPAPFVTAYRHRSGTIFANVSSVEDPSVHAVDATSRREDSHGSVAHSIAIANLLASDVVVAHPSGHGIFHAWPHYGTGVGPVFGAWDKVDSNANSHHVLVTANQVASSNNLSLLTQYSPAVLRCYADCDASTGPGVLDVFDFLCFSNAFAAKDPYACDCDLTTGAGVCDILDFVCYLNAFARGCR